jgi:hypothetical protein
LTDAGDDVRHGDKSDELSARLGCQTVSQCAEVMSIFGVGLWTYAMKKTLSQWKETR